MSDKPLQLIQRTDLVFKRGQKDLYELICKKLEKNESITYEEARKIYFAKGCNIMKDGWPHWSYMVKNNDTGDWKHESKPMSEAQVKYLTFNWLTCNIGKLVVKGALKVIPMIELA